MQDDELLNIEQGYCSAIRKYSPSLLNRTAVGTPAETAKTLVRMLCSCGMAAGRGCCREK